MGLDAPDQRLCDSLIEKKHSKTWYMQKITISASLCSWTDWF